MRKAVTLVIVSTITGTASGCSWWHSDHPTTTPATKTVRLTPGHYSFHLGGRVRVGDKIVCVTRAGAPAGGGFVPRAGNGVGSSTGFSLNVFPSGKVTITCPANPGNA
jgi:hypothetical protein